MNCANCGNQVTNDAKFCNKCGKSIEVNYSNNTILGKVKNHLEFLGYNIKNLESITRLLFREEVFLKAKIKMLFFWEPLFQLMLLERKVTWFLILIPLQLDES
jgi:predicted amidophosphoribosyltransferase